MSDAERSLKQPK